MNTTTVDAVTSGIGSGGASATLHRKIGWAGAFWPPAVRPQSGHWLRRAS